ncbi:hypothetical protein J6590_034209 [Homalodisca vitripennis]|nr:hypothetical protein J6590_034209 [Homalodisca vitripennis]
MDGSEVQDGSIFMRCQDALHERVSVSAAKLITRLGGPPALDRYRILKYRRVTSTDTRGMLLKRSTVSVSSPSPNYRILKYRRVTSTDTRDMLLKRVPRARIFSLVVYCLCLFTVTKLPDIEISPRARSFSLVVYCLFSSPSLNYRHVHRYPRYVTEVRAAAVVS